MEIEVEGEWNRSGRYSFYSLAVDEMSINTLHSGNDELFLKEFKENVEDLNHVPYLKPDLSKFTDDQLLRIIKALKLYQNALDSVCCVMGIKYDNFQSAMDRRINEEYEEDGDEQMLNEFDELIHKAQRQLNSRFNLEICHDALDIWISYIYEE